MLKKSTRQIKNPKSINDYPCNRRSQKKSKFTPKNKNKTRYTITKNKTVGTKIIGKESVRGIYQDQWGQQNRRGWWGRGIGRSARGYG